MSDTVTRAVLLAAGRGTRMGDLTNELPKPMIAVRGKPILLHIIEGLRAAGIADFLLIVGYRANVVRQCFDDGTRHGVRIQYATQVKQDGTGKAVELARAFVRQEPFVLSYGDILVDRENYQRLVTLDEEAEAIVSVIRSEDVSKGGAVFMNERFELIDLREKPQPNEPSSPWYNAGVYTFRPNIFEFTARLERSPRDEYELTDAIRALAHSGKKVQTVEFVGAWADVRDPEILEQLNRSSSLQSPEGSSLRSE
ncbi:MAG TPA: sugar phosphate nucleotidyltransferase [Chthoniobacterales bacterium]